MAEMRSEVPRHAEERQKMEGQRRGNKKFASKKAALLLAWTDSADGQSVRKEAKKESGKQYDWMKQPGESEPSYEMRLRLMKKEDSKKPKVVEAKDAEASKVVDSNSMTIQDDHVDTGKSALAKETADREMRSYTFYQKSWEVNCCMDCQWVCDSCKGVCVHFDQLTLLGSMQYAHCTPTPTTGMFDCSHPYTLQVFSMKLKLTDDNAGGFEFPLSVYGLVGVRDSLDFRRNMLFCCDRIKAQELTQNDPFLLLTGPSRAIVRTDDDVVFEISLKVKGATDSQDKPLITCVGCSAGRSTSFDNIMCTLEVCLRTVKYAVQATVMGVQIVTKKELWPSNFAYGGLVACTPLPMTTDIDYGNQKIVLAESKGRNLPQGGFGYVHLRSQVVSVEVEGLLEVVIQVYKKSGAVAAESCVHFRAQNCQVSYQPCIVGKFQVNVTVAWSMVPMDMYDVVY